MGSGMNDMDSKLRQHSKILLEFVQEEARLGLKEQNIVDVME